MKNRIALAAASSAVAAFATVIYRKTMKVEREKRQVIYLETKEEIEAMRRARDIMLARIQNGEYDGKFDSIKTDLVFYTIINR